MNKRMLRRMIKAVQNGPGLDENDSWCCRECGDPYQLGLGLEPTALCNSCAQTYAITFADALARFMTIETASRKVVTRSHQQDGSVIGHYEGEICDVGTCTRPPGHAGVHSQFDAPKAADDVPMHPLQESNEDQR